MNMKNFVLSFLLSLLCFATNAQIAKWVIEPSYDKIYLAQGAPLVLCDSLNTTILWSMDGRRITSTNDIIHPFREGYAVTVKRGSNIITGFFDVNGKFTSLKNCSIAYGYPFFSEGYLLVKFGNNFRYVNTNGEIVDFGVFKDMYPFNNKYAVCYTYEEIDKLKNPYYVYLMNNGRRVEFSFDGKVFKDKDVDFLSSMSNEGLGIAIIKEKVYFFGCESQRLVPMFVDVNETNKKRQVRIDGDLEVGKNIFFGDSIVILAQDSEKRRLRFSFDNKLLPKGIYMYNNRSELFETITFIKKEEPSKEYASSFEFIKSEDGKFGLKYRGIDVLPFQFDKAGFCFNDYAVAQSGGKWGVLTYDEGLKYHFRINKGNDIAFRHQFFETTVRLDIPSTVPAERCRFEIDPESGCNIDKTSIETKNTESGNYVQYKCTLTIPESLPDVLTEVNYPVQVIYDGIVHPVKTIKTNAWHYKYINVDLNDAETTIENGNLSFTLNITAEKNPGESDYPFEVKVDTDSLSASLVKISETRYKCRVDSLAEGVNNLTINILENGCPPSIFPFEITYVKPVKRTRYKPEVKENVKIEKKVNVDFQLPLNPYEK